MIKKVKLTFPEFNVDIEREFTPWVNLIEEWNWYGKTTIISTILSIFTKTFRWSRTMPDGTASVSMDDKEYLYSKKLWVGADIKNPLAKYIVPGEFFKMNTPDQRLALVDILGIDKAKFMVDCIPEWRPDLMKEYNDILKRNKWRKEVIIEDIKRHDKIIKEFEANPFSVDDNSADLWSRYRADLAVKNSAYNEAIEFNNSIQIKENNLKSDIAYNQAQLNNLTVKRDELRDRFSKTKTNWVCPVCSGPLNKDKITDELNKLNAEGKSIKENIDKFSAKIDELNKALASLPKKKEVPSKVAELNNVDAIAEYFGEKVKYPTPEQVELYKQYTAAQRELPHKKEELKKLWEISIEKDIEDISNAETKFTEYLQELIADTGLDISLFKTQANWEVVESFSIFLDGKPYSELSAGKRSILEVRVAKLFASKLGFDFILIDEAWTLSKDSYDMIVSELEWFQILLFRATPFTIKPKKNVKAS